MTVSASWIRHDLPIAIWSALHEGVVGVVLKPSAQRGCAWPNDASTMARNQAFRARRSNHSLSAKLDVSTMNELDMNAFSTVMLPADCEVRSATVDEHLGRQQKVLQAACAARMAKDCNAQLNATWNATGGDATAPVHGVARVTAQQHGETSAGGSTSSPSSSNLSDVSRAVFMASCTAANNASVASLAEEHLEHHLHEHMVERRSLPREPDEHYTMIATALQKGIEMHTCPQLGCQSTEGTTRACPPCPFRDFLWQAFGQCCSHDWEYAAASQRAFATGATECERAAGGGHNEVQVKFAHSDVAAVFYTTFAAPDEEDGPTMAMEGRSGIAVVRAQEETPDEREQSLQRKCLRARIIADRLTEARDRLAKGDNIRGASATSSKRGARSRARRANETPSPLPHDATATSAMSSGTRSAISTTTAGERIPVLQFTLPYPATRRYVWTGGQTWHSNFDGESESPFSAPVCGSS